MQRLGFAQLLMLYAAMLLCPVVNSNSQVPLRHRVTLGEQEMLREALYLQLSPDGKMLVYVVGEEQGELWLMETQFGSVPRRLFEGTVPVWSPDSRHLAYYSNRSGSQQLWVLDIASGHTEQITNQPRGIDPDPWTRLDGWYYDPLRYSWSPDSTKIVFASQVAATNQNLGDRHPETTKPDSSGKSVRPLVLTATTPPEWTLQGVFRDTTGTSGVTGNVSERVDSDTGLSLITRRVSQLFIADTKTHEVSQLTEGDNVYFTPDWSPDGEAIVCISSEGKSLVGGVSGTTNIYVIELSTGLTRALTTGAGRKSVPHWSPDGDWVAFLGGEQLESLFVIQKQGGRTLNVSRKLDRAIEDFHWSANSDSIVVSYQDGVSWPIARVYVRNGSVDHLSDAPAAFRWPVTVERSGTVAWQQSDGSSRGVIRILPHDGTSSYVLIDLNPQIRTWELGTQEIIRWKNTRGDRLEGILIKPVGYKTGKKYALIVDCYPQTVNGFMGYGLGGNQALAARGYAVFFPNPRGPHVWMNHFKNKVYDQAARGPSGWEITLDDVMSGVREIIQRGIADRDRMGLLGYSNGGAVVNYLVTRTARFKCAVSVTGALGIDWSLPFFLSTSDPMIPTIVGTTPWSNPGAYDALSAIYHVDRVTTPVLLASGDNDSFTLLTNIEMYNALRWFGKEVTFLRYPNQGHGFVGEALGDFWERENKFFDEHLKPER